MRLQEYCSTCWQAWCCYEGWHAANRTCSWADQWTKKIEWNSLWSCYEAERLLNADWETCSASAAAQDYNQFKSQSPRLCWSCKCWIWEEAFCWQAWAGTISHWWGVVAQECSLCFGGPYGRYFWAPKRTVQGVCKADSIWNTGYPRLVLVEVSDSLPPFCQCLSLLAVKMSLFPNLSGSSSILLTNLELLPIQGSSPVMLRKCEIGSPTISAWYIQMKLSADVFYFNSETLEFLPECFALFSFLLRCWHVVMSEKHFDWWEWLCSTSIN